MLALAVTTALSIALAIISPGIALIARIGIYIGVFLLAEVVLGVARSLVPNVREESLDRKIKSNEQVATDQLKETERLYQEWLNEAEPLYQEPRQQLETQRRNAHAEAEARYQQYMAEIAAEHQRRID